MRVPVSWLREWVGVRASVADMAHRLTFGGFEVEAIDEVDGEKVLEIAVTANRGDALSILGIARELSALYQVPLKKKATNPSKSFGRNKKSPVSVKIHKPMLCPRYALAIVEGVTIGDSPEWLQRRLTAAGLRPINNIVDVTNYVLMELGQPLHAFDLQQIRKSQIHVRLAREKEVLRTLDGSELTLEKNDLVIADGERAVALAGVMGGANSEVSDQTTSIALECAFFAPEVIRKTARRLGLQSESSYRFERRVDPSGVPLALQRAVKLIQELAGGELVVVTDLYPKKFGLQKIRWQPNDVERLLGGKWSIGEIKSSLKRLSFGIRPQSQGRWEITVPSYRSDIERSADLVEEVARLGGLDRIPMTFPPLAQVPIVPDREGRWRRRIKFLLGDMGLQEAIHMSFVGPDLIQKFFGESERQDLSLANPLGLDTSILRPSLLPSLVEAASYHHRHKIFNFRAFELRKGFERGTDKPHERWLLSGLLSGLRGGSLGAQENQQVDFYDVKGIVQRILNEMGVSGAEFAETTASYLHPGKSATVQVGSEMIGILGELHPEIVDRFELKGGAAIFELEWERLLRLQQAEKVFTQYSKFPVVERDLALMVDEATRVGDLTKSIKAQNELIQEVRLFDLYRGSQVPQGKKSLAFAIQLGHRERTLTDQEIQDVMTSIMQEVKNTFNADIR